jgi:signal transduction histidine kinase
MAIAVVSRNRKSPANIMFFGMVFFAGLWGAGIATFLLVNDAVLALIAAKTYYFAAIATAAFAALLAQSFPVAKKNFKIYSYVFLSVIIIFGILLIKKDFLTETIIYHDWGKEVILNRFIYNVYGVFLFAWFGFCFVSFLITGIKSKLDDLHKKQVWFLFWGLLAATAVGVTYNYIYPWLKNYRLIWIGPLAVSCFLIGAAYSILRLKLFNVRIFIARSMAYVLSLTVIIIGYLLLAFVLANLFFKTSLTSQQTLYFAFISAIIALFFRPIKKFFDKFSNRIFYRDAYDPQQFLDTVNSQIVTTTDLFTLLNSVAQSVQKNLKTEYCNFYIDEKAAIDFHVAGTEIKRFGESKLEKLIDDLEGNDSKVLVETNEAEELSATLRESDIAAIVKMFSQDLNVGYLFVGQKLSGNSMGGSDLQVLEIIADEVAIAVQNTLRYEEIAMFNVTLQKKIDIATEQLQRTNEKLKALDDAKDEFISMASHQLRTPLTSVKGYISMLIDGDAGSVNDQQLRFLEQAYNSSQRMVYLIADLLNVSRLKTGKFTITGNPTYLPEVVESELNQLQETARARGLQLIYDKPKEFPILNLDETKIRQVIMNFADNAIYYTPKGGRITLKLESTPDSVQLTVNDTGIGVPKSDQHKLFTKFYRAGNARKARPDGTGLGLFMAKKVIIAQGGALIFKTTEGKGSTFGFSFPRAKLEITTPN